MDFAVSLLVKSTTENVFHRIKRLHSMEPRAMSDNDVGTPREVAVADINGEFQDTLIPCIDCSQDFVWTAGEQAFFRDKELKNPPKRCKECKKAKNKRLEAIELAKVTGKKHRIEVKANCARCETSTTVPFYPCQGRPVFCRACFLEMNVPAGQNGSSNY